MSIWNGSVGSLNFESIVLGEGRWDFWFDDDRGFACWRFRRGGAEDDFVDSGPAKLQLMDFV